MSDSTHKITMPSGNLWTPPKRSKWKCYLFGTKPGDGHAIVLHPVEGGEPNWFWRKMHFWAFGNRWVREP